MSIEAGAKAGLIAPDETTFEYLKGRLHAPSEATGTSLWKTGFLYQLTKTQSLIKR